MTVLVSQNSRNYNPQVETVPFGVDAAATELKLMLTHPDWPEGECIRIDVSWPGGQTGQFSTGGGLVRDKQGNPIGGTAVLTWSCAKPAGATEGVANIEVVQQLTTAVLVESF